MNYFDILPGHRYQGGLYDHIREVMAIDDTGVTCTFREIDTGRMRTFQRTARTGVLRCLTRTFAQWAKREILHEDV
jgi:hypothetical protein